MKSGSAVRHRTFAETLESRFLFAVLPDPIAQVAPGFQVGEMRADLQRNVVYVLDQTNKKVVAIDTDLGRTVAHAPLPGVPTSLATSPDGSELYVSSSAANKIAVFSLPDLSLTRTLDVPTPARLAAGVGGKIYVGGSSQSSAMRQVDAQTGEVLASFGSFYSASPVTNPAGTRLFVSEVGLSTTGTTEFDISNLTGAPVLKKSYSTNMSNGREAVVDEGYNRIYSMSGGVYGVRVTDMTSGTGATWPFADSAAYGAAVAYHPDLPYVYGGAQDPYSGGITRYDRATGVIQGSYKPVGSYKTVWELELTPNGKLLYKADPTYSSSNYQIGIVGRSSLVIASVPDARFTTSQSTTSPGLKVSFDGTPSKDYEAAGTIASWSWNFGDNTAAATGSKIDHTYATPGTYTVKLTVADATGLTDEFVGVVKVSDPPVAQPKSVTTNEDVPAPITLQASDPNGDALTYVIVTPPSHGTLSQPNGAAVVYSPAANYFGSDSFTYKANDGRVDGNVATVSLTINAVNDAPVATKDVAPLASGNGVTTVRALDNDFDVEGDNFSITGFTQPTRGAVTLANGVFSYTPTQAYQGFDTFNYTLTDNKGASSTGTVSIAAGVAVLDGDWTTFGGTSARSGYFAGFLGAAEPIPGWTLPAGATNADTIATGGGRVYISDNEAGLLVRAINPSNGATLWTYTTTGSDSMNPPTFFDGRVYVQRGDHSASSLEALDAATGSRVWKSPYAAQWDSYYAPAVSSAGVWVGGGSYGGMYGYRPDGSQITFINQAQIDEWAPSILGDAVYSYVGTNFNKYSTSGSLQWSHVGTPGGSSVMGTLAALSGNLGFVNGRSNLYAIDLTTGKDAWVVNASFNGSPAVANGRVYAISGTTVKSFNTATGAAGTTYAADQALIEQPIVTDDAVFVASASKTYIFARDTGTLLHTLPAGGRISLANNRLYIAAADGSVKTYVFARDDNRAPVANTDTATTPEETAINISALANDTDPDGNPLRITAVAAPAHGTTSINTDQTIRYTPAKDYFGADSFTYTVIDEKGGNATGTVNVTVTPVNDVPVAPAKTVYVPTAGASTITLDPTDIDGNPLTFAIVQQPINGTLSGAGPSFSYTPKPNYTGSDSFTYKVNDGISDSAPGVVTIYVDDAPTVANVTASVPEDQTSTIALSGTDPNGDPLVYKIVTGPAHGTASISGRFLTYKPTADYLGTDSVIYRVNDGIMDSATATVSITVLDENDVPVARNDQFAAASGATPAASLSGDVLANDSDVDGNTLSITTFTQPTNGAVSLVEGKRFSYTPAANYSGLDLFTYTISDGQGGTATATVTVSVGSASLAGEWQTFGNGPAHAGYFPGSVLGATLTPGWSTAVGGTSGFNQLAVAGGKVYAVPIGYFSNMILSALDVKTGAESWRHTFVDGHSLNPPTFYNGRVYLQRGNHGSDTQLFALNAADGNTVWSSAFSAQWENYFAPAINDKGIWINGGYYGGMYGFRHDGTQIKFVNQAQYDEWTPSLLGDNVYSYVAGAFSKYTSDGTAVWTNTKSWNWSGWSMNRVSALAGTRAYMIGNPDLYSVSLTDGTTAWTVPGTFFGSPAIANNVVYAISGSQVKTYDAQTGVARSVTFTADSTITSNQPIVTDDGVFVSTATATYLFHAGSGQLLQKIDRGGVLSLADNTLYIGATNGTVYTYNFNGATPAPPATPQALIVTPEQLSVPEGTSKTFEVKLAAQPAGEILVSVARDSGGDTDLSSAASTLTFNAANWNVVQSVSISAAQDADINNGSASFVVSSNGLASKTVVATEVDDDTALPVTPVTLRAIADAYVRDGSYASQNFGAAADLQLKASSSAGSTREFYLKFDLSSAASVSSAKLRLWGRIDSATQAPQVAVFSVSSTDWVENALNWTARPAAGAAALATQTVATSASKWYEFDVTSYLAAEKAAGRNTVTLLVRSMSATDPYLIFNSDEAAANQPQLVVTPSGGTPPPPPPQELVLSSTGVEVPEGSKSAFGVKLATQPTGSVSVSIARTAGDTDLSVAPPATLTFTSSNWNVNQNVFISALDDADTTNGSATFTLSSAGVASKTITATEADNDAVTPPTGGTVTIRSISDSYVRDGSYATQNFGTATQLVVKKHSYSGNSRESYLRFTLGDVTSTVTAGKLRLFAKSNSASEAVTLSLAAFIGGSWSETGLNWNNKPAGTITLPGTQVVSGTTGKWYEFDVTSVLQQAKAAGSDVTFIVKGLSQTEAQALIESDETSATTNRPQLVVTTGTPLPPVQELVVTPAQLSVGEGASASFNVKLAIAPTSDVVVNIARTGGDTDVSTGTTSLTFTPANWNVTQAVQLTAAQDADTVNGIATFTVSSAGLANRTVTATEADNDVPAAPVTLRATADAYVRDGSSAGANFGAATELQVKKSSSAGSTRDVYLKFDLTNASSISAATLRLNGKIDHASQTAQVAIYAVSDTSWGESTINWNNRPQVGADAVPVGVAKTVAGSSYKWYEWDLTTFLAAEKAAGRNVVTLVVRSLTATDPYLIFNSDEAATNRPELVVTA